MEQTERERRNAAMRRWRKANPEKVAESARRRNAARSPERRQQDLDNGKAAAARRFAADPEAYRAERAAANKAKYDRQYSWVAELKKAPCTDCGLTFPPEAMDFDHGRDTKVKNIAALIGHTTDEKLWKK